MPKYKQVQPEGEKADRGRKKPGPVTIREMFLNIGFGPRRKYFSASDGRQEDSDSDGENQPIDRTQ